MVAGIGIDLFAVERMEKQLREGGEAFAAALFTPEEIRFCTAQRRPARCFAACFAAKEAVAKALALDASAGTAWRSIEIGQGADGEPTVRLHGEIAAHAERAGVRHLRVAIDPSSDLVAASAIAET